MPQLGRVIIGDNVEIGAGTTIDRGGSGDTVIGEGTKIDNLVQIGHNCRSAGTASSRRNAGCPAAALGDFVMLGGQVGVADHITIGERRERRRQERRVVDIPAGETWFGFPAMPGREYLRCFSAMRKRK